MKRLLFLLVVGITAWHGALGQTAKAATLLVPNEYATIQAGIDAAVDGDTVMVADGTYISQGNCDIDFTGKAVTVRSENGPSKSRISHFPVGVDTNENWGHVFYFHSGEGNGSVLEGFTIMSNGYFGSNGIRCEEASPTISNCRIIQNSVGIFCEDSNAVITDCLITDNMGGIYCGYSSVVIDRCTIRDNGLDLRRRYATNVNGRPIAANIEADYGGVSSYESSLSISNCLISGNEGQTGGGITLWYSPNTAITNCTVVGNRGLNDGGVYGLGSSVLLRNCILWENSSRTRRNRFLYPSGMLASSGSVTVSHCCIQGGRTAALANPDVPMTWGEGNIVRYPGFVSPGYRERRRWVEGDYGLLGVSVGVDAGDLHDPNSLVGGTTDRAGGTRIFGAAIDMGAYERQAESGGEAETHEITIDRWVVRSQGTAKGRFVATGRVVDCPDSFDQEMLPVGFGPYAERLDPIVTRGATILYQGGRGRIGLLRLNLNSGRFLLLGQDILLCGLSTPAEVWIDLGDVLALGEFDGNVGAHFMNGCDDVLIVDSVRNRPTKTVIRGGIAVEDTSQYPSAADMTISWGEDEDSFAIVPAGGLRQVGARYVYSSSYGKIRMAMFNLSNGTFVLIIVDSTVPGSGQLRIQFGSFDETAAF